MRKRSSKYRILSVLISVLMVLTMMPTGVFGAEGGSEIGTVKSEEASATAELMDSSIQLGDYVQMGTYYGEPIIWRCVAFYKVDDEGNVDLTDTSKTYKEGYLPLMLSDKIICLKAFDAKGTNTSGSHGRGYIYSGTKGYWRHCYGSNFWGDSNIRDWLNSSASAGNVKWSCGNPPDESNVWSGYNEYDDEAGFLTNFTSSERNAIKKVSQYTTLDMYEYDDMSGYGSIYHECEWNINNVVKNANTTAYKQKFSDKMFLMDVNQVHEVYENSNVLGDSYYIGKPTSKCVSNSEFTYSNLQNGKKWLYWLRSQGAGNSGSPRHVNADGNVYSYNSCISYSGVRPAFFLNLKSAIFTSGSGSADSPYTVTSGDSSSTIKNGIENISVYFYKDEYTSINNSYAHRNIKPGEYLTAPDIPTKDGYVFAGWYASESRTGVPLLFKGNDTLSYDTLSDMKFNSKFVTRVVNKKQYYTGNITLFAKWEKINSFSQPDDVLPFLNSAENFQRPDGWNFIKGKYNYTGEYEIRTDDYALLLKNEGYSAKLWSKKKSNWEGSCFGMSVVACLAKAGMINVKNYNSSATKTSDLNIIKNQNGDVDVGVVESLVNYYHLSQCLNKIDAFFYYSNESNDLKTLITKMKTSASPVIILLIWYDSVGNITGGHAVVGYDLEESGNEYIIKIYDCSESIGSYYLLKIDKSTYTKSCSEWEKSWNSNIKICSTITVDEICNNMKFRLASENETANEYELTTDYGDFTISDGLNDACISGGAVVSDDIGIKEYGPQNEAGFDMEWMYGLPEPASGQYIITADAGKTIINYAGEDGFYYSVNSDSKGEITIGSCGDIDIDFDEDNANSEIWTSNDVIESNWNCAMINVNGGDICLKPEKGKLSMQSDDNTSASIFVATPFEEYIIGDNIEIGTDPIYLCNGNDEQECCLVLADNSKESTVIGYDVVFSNIGGEAVESQFGVTPGSLITEPNAPTREGYKFLGWFKDEEFTEVWDFECDTVEENTVLYAGWELDLDYFKTITFSIAGQNAQTMFVETGTIVGTECLNDMFTVNHGTVTWDDEILKLLEEPVEDNLELDGTIIPDCDGSSLSLSCDGQISDSVSFTVTNAMNVDYSTDIIITACDKNGKPIDLQIQTVEAKSNADTSFYVDAAKYDADTIIKAFILIKTNGYKPVCEKVEYKL